MTIENSEYELEVVSHPTPVIYPKDLRAALTAFDSQKTQFFQTQTVKKKRFVFFIPLHNSAQAQHCHVQLKVSENEGDQKQFCLIYDSNVKTRSQTKEIRERMKEIIDAPIKIQSDQEYKKKRAKKRVNDTEEGRRSERVRKNVKAVAGVASNLIYAGGLLTAVIILLVTLAIFNPVGAIVIGSLLGAALLGLGIWALTACIIRSRNEKRRAIEAASKVEILPDEVTPREQPEYSAVPGSANPPERPDGVPAPDYSRVVHDSEISSSMWESSQTASNRSDHVIVVNNYQQGPQ